VRGHAVECRLYAEDPDNNFFPCTGRVLTWRPAAIAGVRYDGGIRSGTHGLMHAVSHTIHTHSSQRRFMQVLR
jgi:acetyl/propionyl-CoA carboxylase alpha subunit